MIRFTVSDKEEKSAKKWIRKHLKTCEKAKIERAKYGRRTLSEFLSYIFTGTQIATAVSARCSFCREEVDVTDYSTW